MRSREALIEKFDDVVRWCAFRDWLLSRINDQLPWSSTVGKPKPNPAEGYKTSPWFGRQAPPHPGLDGHGLRNFGPPDRLIEGIPKRFRLPEVPQELYRDDLTGAEGLAIARAHVRNIQRWARKHYCRLKGLPKDSEAVILTRRDGRPRSSDYWSLQSRIMWALTRHHQCHRDGSVGNPKAATMGDLVRATRLSRSRIIRQLNYAEYRAACERGHLSYWLAGHCID